MDNYTPIALQIPVNQDNHDNQNNLNNQEYIQNILQNIVNNINNVNNFPEYQHIRPNPRVRHFGHNEFMDFEQKLNQHDVCAFINSSDQYDYYAVNSSVHGFVLIVITNIVVLQYEYYRVNLNEIYNYLVQQ